MQFEEPDELYIPVYNNTLKDIIIEADTEISEIKIYSTDVDICQMAVGELDEKHSTIHKCNNAISSMKMMAWMKRKKKKPSCIT
jgi:hypothetical protein